MEAAIVTSRPQRARVGGILGEREDDVGDLDAGDVVVDRTARRLLLRLVVGGQIRADRLPRHAAVAGAVHVLRRVIHDVPVVLRYQDRRYPLEPVLQVLRGLAELELGVDDDAATLVGIRVEPADGAPVAPAVDDFRVIGMERDRSRLARRCIPPVAHGMQDVRALPRREADTRVVLLRRVHAIREPVVHHDVVELGGRLQVHRRPGLAPVERDHAATVVAEDHDVPVGGIDPEVVGVAVRHVDHVEGLSTVHGPEQLDVQTIDRVLIDRVSDDAGVVPRPLPQLVLAVCAGPGLSGIVGAVYAACRFGFDHRPDAIGIRGRDRQPDLSDDSRRKASGELLPRVAAVHRLINAAFGPS